MNFALRHTGDLSRVWSASHPMEAGLSPSSPWELNKQSGWMNGEVNGCSYGCSQGFVPSFHIYTSLRFSVLCHRGITVFSSPSFMYLWTKNISLSIPVKFSFSVYAK